MTGLIGRIDLRTGSMALVNAGHVAPYLARGAHVTAVELPVDLPLGLFPDTHYRDTTSTWSRVTGSSSSPTGCSSAMRSTSISRRRSSTPGRCTRERRSGPWLTASSHATGHALNDDATMLCLDWHDEHGRDRDSVHGAEQCRASERERRPSA